MPRPSRHSPEFQRDAVALVRSGPHRTIADVATELGVNRETLRSWVRREERAGTLAAGGMGPTELEELRTLRSRVASQVFTLAVGPQRKVHARPRGNPWMPKHFQQAPLTIAPPPPRLARHRRAWLPCPRAAPAVPLTPKKRRSSCASSIPSSPSSPSRSQRV
ncbi:transposase [Streptacidiphilus sp. BW17]|uniref:transposase n=1 Tax=Streptacidiphilus sp. BW17 TaxID=3156274 RepID=UPI0035159CF1